MLTCKVLTTFDPFPDQPAAIIWTGVLDFHEDAKPDEAGRTRLLKLQCSMRQGMNGLFLTMPFRQKCVDGRLVPALDKTGKYRTIVDVGHLFQRLGVKTIQQWMVDNPGHGRDIDGPTAIQTEMDLREAAKQTFAEEGTEATPSTPDDPFGELKW
jgi:hypothetical protein